MPVRKTSKPKTGTKIPTRSLKKIFGGTDSEKAVETDGSDGYCPVLPPPTKGGKATTKRNAPLVD